MNDLQEYKTAKNIFKNMCRAKRLSHESKFREKLVKNRNDPNYFWKCLKQLRSKSNKSSHDISGQAWFDYFKNLFSCEIDDNESNNAGGIIEDIQWERDD